LIWTPGGSHRLHHPDPVDDWASQTVDDSHAAVDAMWPEGLSHGIVGRQSPWPSEMRWITCRHWLAPLVNRAGAEIHARYRWNEGQCDGKRL